MKMKMKMIDEVNGTQLGSGRKAARFFELRGFANRKPNQGVGDCALWNALSSAVEESKNAELIARLNGSAE
jgi:hypothetical protein